MANSDGSPAQEMPRDLICFTNIFIFSKMISCSHPQPHTRPLFTRWYSLMAQMVKNLPAMQGTQVQSLGQEDVLEKGMATHSSILAWRIPWTEEPGGPQSMGSQRVGHDQATNTCIFHFHFISNGGSASSKEEKLLKSQNPINLALLPHWTGLHVTNHSSGTTHILLDQRTPQNFRAMPPP